MLWAAAAESTHSHPNPTEAASCPICVVAHTASPTLSSTNTAPVFSTVALLQEEEVIVKARFDFSDVGIRGPPATL
jgi:hypothetical protein